MKFQKKVNSFLDIKPVENQFVKQSPKVSSETELGNEAKKYSTTENDSVNNFATASYFKELRSYKEIAEDMQVLWKSDPKLCVKLAIYIRLNSHKSKIIPRDKINKFEVQRKLVLKHEGIMRMLWLATNQPATFKMNIPLFITTGSWGDIIQMLSLDIQYHGWDDRKIDWIFLYLILLAGLSNPETTHLVRQYLPTIRTNKNCTTLESQATTFIGRWLARKLSPGLDKESAYKAYRQIKSKGISYEQQQFIFKRLYSSINFGRIVGKTLSLLVESKFLKNYGLDERYASWISDKFAANISKIIPKESKNEEELFESVMNQELLDKVQILYIKRYK